MSLFERVAEKGIDSETVEFFCTNQDYNFEDNEFDIVPTALNDPCFSGWNESYDPFVNLVDPESFWIRDKELFSKAENNLFEKLNKFKSYEIVRCKDCVHHNNCSVEFAGQFNDNGFCSYGEYTK